MILTILLCFASLFITTSVSQTCCIDRLLPCCPLNNGVCCGDGQCCPFGMKCSSWIGVPMCCSDYACSGWMRNTRTNNSPTCPAFKRPKPTGPHQCEACCPFIKLCCKDKCLLNPIRTACTADELARTYPVNVADLNSAFQWLLCTEGFNVSGYCPTTASGLTIGAGVDFGQQNSWKALQKVGTPPRLIQRVNTFLGAKCTDECFNPGYSTVVKLCLTVAEASVLTKGFLADVMTHVEPYTKFMSSGARDALISIRYFAGALGQGTPGSRYPCGKTFSSALKLCVPNGSGQTVNLIWDAIKNKDATTSDVQEAIRDTLTQYKILKYSTGIGRFTKELDKAKGGSYCGTIGSIHK